MSNFTNFTEQALRDHFMRDTQLALEDTFVGLTTADPTETGSTVSEVSGGGYARQQVFQATATTPYWTNHSTATGIQNAQDISFGTATGNWGTVTHVIIADAVSGGNVLFYGPLATSTAVNSGNTFTISTSNLQVAFD